MSLTVTLIAKLSRVDLAVARRALGTARSQDFPVAAGAAPQAGSEGEEGAIPVSLSDGVPVEFHRGRRAMAYALALLIVRKPVHFYVGLTGLVIFPIYIAWHVPGWFHGR